MKKIYLSIMLWGCSIIVTYAQSVYMHEAQQEAEECGTTGFSGIFSILVFFGLVYLISKIWPSKNKNSSNSTNSTYYPGIDDIDDDIRWKEEIQEKAEMEELDHLKDIEDNDYYFNSYDSSIKKESSKEKDDVPQKPKYHPSTGDEFFDKIVCEQEEKYYPIGSIKDRLQNLTKERFVDLGLTVKWSSKNIGSTEIFDLGYYFRWGSMDYLESYNRDKILEYSKIPYSKEIENIIDIICANPKYDMATKFSDGEERLPTKEEFEELINKCNWEYIEIDKYKGFIITGPSGKSIYLPMAYHSFVNCMQIIMMSVGEAYPTGVPELENEYDFEEKCAFYLGINNKNHTTEDFEIRVSSYFKHCFHPVRGVVLNKKLPEYGM